MPADWEAGVMNHGSYYQWFTVSDQPILFMLSVALFFGAWLLVIVTVLSKRHTYLTKF